MPIPRDLNAWVDEIATLAKPDKVVWVSGAEAEKDKLIDEAEKSGEVIRLNQKKLPGCIYHRSDPNDVARVEDCTYICSSKREDAGPTNNWMSPKDAKNKVSSIFKGSMKGRTMYVVPFCMGPIGSPFSKIGVQLTDSIYVVLNMRIMTRVGSFVLDWLATKGEYTKCIHGKADLNRERRFIMHFPEENLIWSVGSGYGGNALLGKKCLALRIASYLANKEGWFAEHMLITGIEDPSGNVNYIAAAFPSACGKTNLAMIRPPDEFRRAGYKVWVVGDDIAWMRIGTDGRLWAINPESGFFGVVPGTNSKTNPNMMKTIATNTIYTNVALKSDKTVWWEDSDEAPVDGMVDWMGRQWKPGMKDAKGIEIKAAHPNSRFTVPVSQCPIVSSKWDSHDGVPISAIIFGARRPDVVPLVYQSLSWNHGVYVGATVASTTTAAQQGKIGVLRRDPMAMLPFCGYNMGDYFSHWIRMGTKIPNPPKIFHVNWFREDENGQFIWPGFGENFRVILWILSRCRGNGAAAETPIGFVPRPEDIGSDISGSNLVKLLSVDKKLWRSELNSHKEFFKKFGGRFPPELWTEYNSFENRLTSLSSVKP